MKKSLINSNRQLLLGLGAIAITSIPIFSVISCKYEEINNFFFESSGDSMIKIVISGKHLPLKSSEWEIKYESIGDTTNNKITERYWLNI